MTKESMALPYTYVAHDEHDNRHYGSVAIPIYQTTLFTTENHNTQEQEYKYSRMGNPTVDALQEKLAHLEGGEMARCFASGMAAISAAITSVVKTGDHIICTHQCYFGTKEFLDFFLARYGIEVSYVDCTSTDSIRNAIKENTALLYLESPTSFYFQLQNLRQCAELAKSSGITTIIDNTWASPCFQHPLGYGIDLSVHSLTKYVGGHSDALGGVVIGNRERIESLSRIEQQLLGGIMTPQTASILLRGLRTLPLRMARLQQSVLTVAEYLEQLPFVRRVNFPGLSSHPQHELAISQMKGFGSLLSFEIQASVEQTKQWASRLKLFRIGLSFGGYESLALVVGPVSGEELKHSYTLVRLNVGLEEPQDLIQDMHTNWEPMSF